jgi:hypothetical protein
MSLNFRSSLETGRNVYDRLGDRMFAPTGEEYAVLTGLGGEDEARAAFESYAKGRPGVLYWRTVPEFRNAVKRHPPAYYMRLLISDTAHAAA